MATVFDPIARRIILDVTSISASQLWAQWSTWAASGDNLKWLPAMLQVGGNSLPGGRVVPIYILLINGWRVRPMEADHDLKVTGNLEVDESDLVNGPKPVVSTLGTFRVNTTLEAPVAAQGYSTGAASLSQSDILAIRDAVWAKELP